MIGGLTINFVAKYAGLPSLWPLAKQKKAQIVFSALKSATPRPDISQLSSRQSNLISRHVSMKSRQHQVFNGQQKQDLVKTA
jgi:hypothetical protein